MNEVMNKCYRVREKERERKKEKKERKKERCNYQMSAL